MIDQGGKTQDAKIGIYFKTPENVIVFTIRINEYPSVSFIATRYNKKICVHESTMSPGSGGQSGKAGEYTIDQITIDLIHQKIMKV